MLIFCFRYWVGVLTLSLDGSSHLLHDHVNQVAMENEGIMLKTLFTIGYEGLTLRAFLLILKSNGVERIIDVRRNPISRKAGFSKSALSEALAFAEIDYVHIVELGTPHNVREELKTHRDYDDFFEKMEVYVSSQKSSLMRALDLSLEKPSALLCFERNPKECHRIVVATQLVQLSDVQLTLEHLWL